MGDNPAWLPGGPGGEMPPIPDMSKVDPGLQPVLITLLYLCPGIALAILLVRFWKKWQDKMLGGDDVLIALAWILTLGNSIIVHLFVKAIYAGYRDEDVPPFILDFDRIFKLQYALGLEYPPCICLVKASFLWSLYKLRSFNPWIKRTIIALQVINGVFMVVTTVVGAVPCLPVARAWNKALPGGCYDPLKYVIANISIVLITDFMVLLIPTWIIYDLQMALKRKIVTIAFLSLGFIVIGVGIARLLWLLEAFSGNTKSYSVKSAYSAIELSVAIIGTCGPTIKFILSRFIPFLRPSFERGTTKKSYGSYGNHSSSNNNNTASRGISQRNAQHNNDYDDLSSISAHEEHIEMKNGWRRDDDARSDEQIMADQSHGIVKSVGWTVQESSQPGTPRILGDPIPRDPIQRETRPAHIV